MKSSLILFLACFVLFSPSGVDAGPFELIYTDSLDVDLCLSGCGIILGISSFALIANTSEVAFTEEDIRTLEFTVSSSVPAIDLRAGPYSLWQFTPILPGEVVGSVTMYNDVLLGHLENMETFRNTTPHQVLTFNIWRDYYDPYEGDVEFDVTVRMGDEMAQFKIYAEVSLGDTSISFLSASRVASKYSVPSQSVSWGAVKALYR